MLFDTGYRKPICQLTVLHKSGVRLALLDYHCMLKVKASMDQFIEGLKELHVLDLIKKYPQLTKPFFVSERRNLLQVYTYFYTIVQCLALVVVVVFRDFEGNG